MEIIVFISAATAFALRQRHNCSWLYALPIFVAYFLLYHGYRNFIYERFINPLSRLPGPKGNWLGGKLLTIMREEPGQAHLRWLRKYRNPTGLITYPGLFYVRQVMATSTTAIQHVLNSPIYRRPETVRRAFRIILGDGLVIAEGEAHERQKKILNPAFATGYIREIVPIFVQKGNELVDALVERLSSQSTAEGMDVSNLVTRSTLDIIGSACFGHDLGSLHDPNEPFAKAYSTIFHEAPTNILSLAGYYIPWISNIPLPIFSRASEVSDARKSIVTNATKLVQDRESNSITGKDMLSLMIAENRKAEGRLAEEGLAEVEIVNQVMTFLCAGHETTSTSLIWGLWLLAQHPEIQERLRSETQQLQEITLESIESCRYLNNVCKEILRYAPPVSGTSRVASVTHEINGVTIPKDTVIFVSIAATNFDEQVWGPDVDTFNPDRWENLPETASNYSYLTFSQGRRICIGRKFAETYVKIILIKLIQRFRFGETVKGKRVVKEQMITTRPKGGISLKISPV